MQATYSPDDNKLRLYAGGRLDAETYARVKAAGFRWAGRQELFVAPMWTPGRVDLLIELCGDIGDEDTSLAERAEERAEAFDGYQANRRRDSESASDAVSAITEHIPLGQPILVGHHSEKHARRDAAKIERGMARAVKMWETAEYWKRRAAGALANAEYKERPEVRARRIKRIEKDQRRENKERALAVKFLELWSRDGLTLERATAIANHHECRLTFRPKEGENWGESAWQVLSAEGAGAAELARCVEAAKRAYPRSIAWCDRWLSHYANRLEYERTMLGESGGIAADKFDIQPGGQVLRRGEWFPVVKLNRHAGKVSSVTVIGHWARSFKIEEVADYREPEPGAAEAIKKATAKPPLKNYPGPGFEHITNAQWKAKHKDYKGSRILPVERKENSCRSELGKDFDGLLDGGERHRVRTWVSHAGGRTSLTPVYITDMKTTYPKKTDTAPEKPPTFAPVAKPEPSRPRDTTPEPAGATNIEAMREQLKTGVQIVTAPDLFPTPPDLAAKVISFAGIEAGQAVLEPSAGTGNIAALFRERVAVISNAGGDAPTLQCVEINGAAVERLQSLGYNVKRADFLDCNGDLGKFDRVVMNPPFSKGADIKHIEHALTFLKPGGRLVAVCANGPRQRAAFIDRAEHWEDLPAGTFKQSGTNVNTALVVLTATGD